MVDSTPASAETVAPIETPVAVVETPVVETPTLSKRDAINAKYAAMYYGTESPAPAVEVPQPEVVPPVVEAVQPSVDTAPAPVASPAPSAVTPSAIETLLTANHATMESLAATIKAMQDADLRRNPPPPPVEVEDDFITRLREGDVKGAKTAMRDAILAELKAAQGTPVDVNAAIAAEIAKVQERATLETELNTFISGVRAANPDTIPMESYIALTVQARMDADKAAGKLTSPKAYADSYKIAVNDEIAKARKILQQTRATATTEARTTNREVLASSTVAPSAVNTERGVAAQVEGEPDITPTSYLQRRLAATQAGKRL